MSRLLYRRAIFLAFQGVVPDDLVLAGLAPIHPVKKESLLEIGFDLFWAE